MNEQCICPVRRGSRRGAGHIDSCPFAAEVLEGGLGDGRPDEDFDAEQLAEGTEVEFEHTTDEAAAKEIAKDHLTEHPDYYTGLEEMERILESKNWDGEPEPKPAPKAEDPVPVAAGAVIGYAVGGPVGGLIGGALGRWFGKRKR